VKGSLDLWLLETVHPEHGYIPDFLSPPPLNAHATVATELKRVSDTPPERVAAEIRQCLSHAGSLYADRLGRLTADPSRTLTRLVSAIADAWSLLLKPRWPEIRRVLDDDVAYRGRCLTGDGLSGLFQGIHPSLSLQDDQFIASQSSGPDFELNGSGVLFIPSLFIWPRPSVVIDPLYQPSVIYPARGIARLWGESPRATDRLARLLGHTRAAILEALDEPASTTGLARLHSLSRSTVSEHLNALFDARLAHKRRDGHEVFYWQTPLGRALVGEVA
jgi:DNA-binding transcriptional ArsR family regulator